MKPILYLEGASGISGDMTVAALLDLGASREALERALRSLGVEGLSWRISRKHSYGLAGCDFEVIDAGAHGHGHEHGHGHGPHAHAHRHLADIETLIDRGEMTEGARALAKKIFRIVAEAEAKAHGCPAGEVHFHEVGAVDSIADIVGAAVLADALDLGGCAVTGLSEGSGTVLCQHGELPVPVPAVLNIAQAYGIPLRIADVRGERVTPTGIAIAAALRTASALPEAFTVRRVGIGLGKRDFGGPNILRAMLLEAAADPERIYVLEANIDDATGEMMGFAMEQLLAGGARDVHFVPCYMKKNRPGQLLRVVTDDAHLAAMEETIFRTTTTIGLRKLPVERTCMAREMREVRLPVGTVRVKRCAFGSLVRYYPEYESVRRAADAAGVDFRTVYEAARREAERG